MSMEKECAWKLSNLIRPSISTSAHNLIYTKLKVKIPFIIFIILRNTSFNWNTYSQLGSCWS